MRDFDKDFRSTRRLAIAAFIFAAIIKLGVVGFVLWLAYRITMHFIA